ncbi:MAG: hypothetical protein ABI181_14830 [Mycobacteriaceae bacterium]
MTTAVRAVPVGPGRDAQTDVVATLRRRLAAIPGRGVETQEPAPTAATGVLPVPAPLAELLPRGGLVRGTVVSAAGASSLLLGLLAAVTSEGGWAAVVGRPGLGLLAAVEMGADLARVALVPAPGGDALDVAAVLLDGVDLVVLDLAGTSVAPSRARGLVARARHRGSVLVVTGGTWPGAQLQLRAEVTTGTADTGLGRGYGRLRSRELEVQVGGRGSVAAGRCSRVRLCPDGAGVRWRTTAGEGVGAAGMREQAVVG